MPNAAHPSIAEAFERARRERPGLGVTSEAFGEFVASRLPDEGVEAALETLHAGDALLAAGCLTRDAESLAVFSRELEPVIARAVRKVVRDQAQDADDACRRIVVRLLYGEDGSPKLESYLARGPLAGWVQVTASRFALNVVRDRRAVQRREDVRQLDERAASGDLELDHIRARYRDEFRDSFKEGLANLAPRDRNVLRYHLLDSLGIDEIGALYGVHRATAARWIHTAREHLLASVKRAFAARLKVSDAEFESLFFAVRSHLDVSLGSFLHAGPEDE